MLQKVDLKAKMTEDKEATHTGEEEGINHKDPTPVHLLSKRSNSHLQLNSTLSHLTIKPLTRRSKSSGGKDNFNLTLSSIAKITEAAAPVQSPTRTDSVKTKPVFHIDTSGPTPTHNIQFSSTETSGEPKIPAFTFRPSPTSPNFQSNTLDTHAIRWQNQYNRQQQHHNYHQHQQLQRQASTHQKSPLTRLESVGTALLPALSRRTTISERSPSSPFRSHYSLTEPRYKAMFNNNNNTKHTIHTDYTPNTNTSISTRKSSSRRRSSSDNKTSLDNSLSGTIMQGIHTRQQDNTSNRSLTVKTMKLPLSTRTTYEIPNDNENDGQYASEFWLNALVPKPHTNFFGYETSIGPICISISTRESHECYKALIRTPFNFSVVYVPTMVIKEPMYGPDLERLSNPTPQKILLYNALRIYFQHADEERRGYLLTALRNQRLSAENSARADFLASMRPANIFWDTSDSNTAHNSIASASKDSPSKALARRTTIKHGTLQRSNTRRSNELRRTEVRDFMDRLFSTTDNLDTLPEELSPLSHPVTVRTEDMCEDDVEDEALLFEADEFITAEQEQRDMAVATESLMEIRDDQLKPLLRNLEPKLFRRRLRIDFVVIGAEDHVNLVDANSPHCRFLRTLERANARMRGDTDSVASSSNSPVLDSSSLHSSPNRPKGESVKPQNKTGTMGKSGPKKTLEQLKAKRKNIINELIETERNYVEKVRALIDIYAVPLRSAARSADNSLIPAYDAHVIFGNIERVYEVNERFLGDLEAWNRGEMDPNETIGSLCRDHFVDFHVYKRYINGYQHAIESSNALEARNPLYAAFLHKAREREECKKLWLSDLLIMPVQRIPRYTLLLTDLLKVTPEDDQDVQRIQLALERVNEIGQLADNQVAESVAELHRIHISVEGCPPNLISASRSFIGAIDATEVNLANGRPTKPMSLLVFSDLLMIVERYWPPRGHGGIRITGNVSGRDTCPVHSKYADSTNSSSGGIGSNSSKPGTSGGSAAMLQRQKQKQHHNRNHQTPQAVCTCNSNSSSVTPTTAFTTTSSSASNGKKKWGQFAGWVDISRVNVLEKNIRPGSKSFFLNRYPPSIDELHTLNTECTSRRQLGTAPRNSSSNSSTTATPVLESSGSAEGSKPMRNRSSTSGRSFDGGALSGRNTDELHALFSQILYPGDDSSDNYGGTGYWYPQSLHEFETDNMLARDALFEFLDTAWDRAVARCFESAVPNLSRNGSNSGSGNSLNNGKSKLGSSKGQLQGGVNGSTQHLTLGHPELDRVDAGGQSWNVRIWDSVDYARSRHECPSALVADLTVVWDYQHAKSTCQDLAESNDDESILSLRDQLSTSAIASAIDLSDAVYYPFQACRVVDLGGGSFHIASTVLPLDFQHTSIPLDTYAELIEVKETVDSWPGLCRVVEQAVVMYQYVLLAYPEHHRIQQCYNRSILASLFAQISLAFSSVKSEAVSTAPRKLLSRARHLFSSSSMMRGSGSGKESTTDVSSLFSSAYGTASPITSGSSSPHNHSSASFTMFARNKVKPKASTMTPGRHAQSHQRVGSQTMSGPIPFSTPVSRKKSSSSQGSPVPMAKAATSSGVSSSASGNAASRVFVFSAGAGHARASSMSTRSNEGANSSTSSNKMGAVTRGSSNGNNWQSSAAGHKNNNARSSSLKGVPMYSETTNDSGVPSNKDTAFNSGTLPVSGRTATTRSQSEEIVKSLTSSPLKPKKHGYSRFGSFTAGGRSSSTLDTLPNAFSGSTPSLVRNTSETERSSTRPRTTSNVKRRSLSVVSARSQMIVSGASSLRNSIASKIGYSDNESLDSAATDSLEMIKGSSVTGAGPTRTTQSSPGQPASHIMQGTQGDKKASKFSLEFSGSTSNKRLELPDDLRLEFDEALSGAGITPPQTATYGPLHSESDECGLGSQFGLDLFERSLSAISLHDVEGSNSYCRGDELGVIIPSQSDVEYTESASSWDIRSPEETAMSDGGLSVHIPVSRTPEIPTEPHYSVADSSASYSGGKNSATRHMSRRRGVYGGLPKTPEHQTPQKDRHLSPQGMNISLDQPRKSTDTMRSPVPHGILSEADILIDIARELDSDQQRCDSPCYIDDDDVADHFYRQRYNDTTTKSPRAQTADAVNRPLPAIPTEYRPLPPLPPQGKSGSRGSEDGSITLATFPSINQMMLTAHMNGPSRRSESWRSGARSPQITSIYPIKPQTPPVIVSARGNGVTDYPRLPPLPPARDRSSTLNGTLYRHTMYGAAANSPSMAPKQNQKQQGPHDVTEGNRSNTFGELKPRSSTAQPHY